MKPGLVNYTFLTPKTEMNAANVYEEREEQVLEGFSNIPLQVADSRQRTYTPAHMANATIRWVIKDRLARGARPGFSGRRAVQVSQATVDAWLRRVKTRYGIRSIICLLDENSLKFYSRIPGGLISYYRTRGFKVEFIRVRNRRTFSDAQLRRVWRAYKRLSNAPVLVHCSAGRGRTGKAVTHIKRKLGAALKPRSIR